MTDHELAILGLLMNEAADSETLLGAIAMQGLDKWMVNTTTSGSLNIILEKLCEQGLVVRQKSRLGVTTRYALTQAGIGVLNTSVTEFLNGAYHRETFFVLGLAHAHLLPPVQVWRALHNYRAQLEADIARLEELPTVSPDASAVDSTPGAFEALHTARYRLTMLHAEYNWMSAFIEAYQVRYPDAAEDAPPMREVPPPRADDRVRKIILPHHPDSVHRRTTVTTVTQDSPDAPGTDDPSSTPVSNRTQRLDRPVQKVVKVKTPPAGTVQDDSG